MERKHKLKTRISYSYILFILVALLLGCQKSKMPNDGVYEVSLQLEGGSGRATVTSPTRVEVKDGKLLATVCFSSPYYDYMLVEGNKYLPVNTEGNSCFVIPIMAQDGRQNVVADTTAMSTPHEIDYVLAFDLSEIYPEQRVKNESFQDANENSKKTEPVNEDDSISYTELKSKEYMPLEFATQFQVEYFEQGYKQIHIKQGGDFLLIPEDGRLVSHVPDGITVLKQPLQSMYVVSSAAMDPICHANGLSHVRFSGIKQTDWYLDDVKLAMEKGSILYAGKYSSPDYEMLLEPKADLAIENTMILHTPKVKEQLENLGIPVMIEKSSYESSPLGRMEWIKLYAALFDQEKMANDFFEEQIKKIEPLSQLSSTQKKVAIFALNNNGAVTVRKSGDYMVRMLQMAGGEYAFPTLSDDENALSTMHIQMEAFYEGAKDADILIYNSTIEGEIDTLQDLLKKSELLADFKAVKKNQVYCLPKSFFQCSTGIGDLILDLHAIFTEDVPEQMNYLYHLK